MAILCSENKKNKKKNAAIYIKDFFLKEERTKTSRKTKVMSRKI